MVDHNKRHSTKTSRSEKRRIVFIRSLPDMAQVRMAQLLKESADTHGIYFAKNNVPLEDFTSTHFFPNTLTGYYRAYKTIRRINPHTLIGVSESVTLVALFFVLFMRTNKVFFPYDIKHFRPNDQKGLVANSKWYIALYSERYCFIHSNRIIHKGHPDELTKVPFSRALRKKPTYLFREFLDTTAAATPTVQKKLSARDGEIHLVYAGGLYFTEGSDAESFWTFYPKITVQRIHLHVYAHIPSEHKKRFDAAVQSDPYLHYEGFFDNTQLLQALGTYDYGIHMFGAGTSGKQELILRSAFSNKDYDYITAGIPVIASTNLTAVKLWIEEHGIGFCVDYDTGIPKLKTLLARKDKAVFERNIRRFVKRAQNSQNAFIRFLE